MRQPRRRTLSLTLACTGLATAGITMWLVWSYLNSARYAPAGFLPPSLWPLPGVYLIEVVALAAVVLLSVVAARYYNSCSMAWLALGALSAMMLLGAMSIGPYIALVLLSLIPASVLAAERSPRLAPELVGLIVGFIVQGGIMFSIILLRTVD